MVVTHVIRITNMLKRKCTVDSKLTLHQSSSCSFTSMSVQVLIVLSQILLKPEHS